MWFHQKICGTQNAYQIENGVHFSGNYSEYYLVFQFTLHYYSKVIADRYGRGRASFSVARVTQYQYSIIDWNFFCHDLSCKLLAYWTLYNSIHFFVFPPSNPVSQSSHWFTVLSMSLRHFWLVEHNTFHFFHETSVHASISAGHDCSYILKELALTQTRKIDQIKWLTACIHVHVFVFSHSNYLLGKWPMAYLL